MVHEAFYWLYQEMSYLGKFILTHFFENDIEVSVPTLLAAKQKKRVSIKEFVVRFWGMVLQYPSGMTLVYIGRNLSPQSVNHTSDSNKSRRMVALGSNLFYKVNEKKKLS